VAVAAAAMVTFGSCLIGPAPAGAHGESSPLIRTVVDEVAPATPSLRVSTEVGPAAALSITNDSPVDVEVVAPGGESFLRIGRAGVFANVSSAEWYRSGNPDGRGRFPPGIVPGSAPRWVPVSRQPSFTWFEHRLHPAPISVPRELAGTERRQRLSDWTVPLRVGGAPGRIDGYIEYRPLLGSVTAEIKGSPEPLPGVLMYVLPGPVPALFVENTGRARVLVRGRAGEPFARIGPGGAEVNVRSPTHQDDLRVKGRRPALAADPEAAPAWREVDAAPRYLWLDARARYGPGQPPDAVVDGRAKTVLGRWEVPVETSASKAVVQGTTSWVPAPPASTPSRRDEDGKGLWTALLLGGVACGVGLLVALGLRRRRP
jgi:hypothetical protein